MGQRRCCRIESLWHVELEEGCVPHMIVERGEILGDLVVCGYSHRHAGVLLVDSRQGDILSDIPFFDTTRDGKKERVVCIDVLDDARVVCVTSMGFVWSFQVCLDGQGVFERVENICSSDVLFKAMEQEDSPMEGVVMEALHERNEDGGMHHDGASLVQGPEFIMETGYRGPRQGYTYCKEKNGYYRNDCMRGRLQETLETSKHRRVVLQKGLIRCFVRLPKTSRYVMASCGSEDGMVYVGQYRIHSEEDGMGIEATCEMGLIGHLSGVLVLAVSPDEAYVASGSYDQTIRIWDTKTWTCTKILKGHGGGIKCLWFSRDGSLIFSAASDNTIRIWSTSTWMCMRHLHGRHEDATWPVCMAVHEPDDDGHSIPRFLLSGSNGLFGGSTLKVFDIESGDCLTTFAQLRYDHKGSCSAVCIMPPDRQCVLLTGATDCTLAAWDCSFQIEEKKALLKGGFFK